MPNNKEIIPGPICEIRKLPQRERFLNEQFTGAQALILLGIRPPEKGKSVPQLKETPIIEFATKSISREHKEKIKKASFNEREEFWKDIPRDQRMEKWKKSMNTFLDVYKKDPQKEEGLVFLKKILKKDDQKAPDEVAVSADNIYSTFMQGEGKGDVEFFARRIIETTDNNTEEIRKNQDLIKNLGNIYGGNSAKIVELLTHGIANVKKNPDAFIKSAQENLDKGNYGDTNIWTELDNNKNQWDDKQNKEEEKIPKDTKRLKKDDQEKADVDKKEIVDTSRVKPQTEGEFLDQWQGVLEESKKERAEEVKKEIFTLAENKDKTYAEKLLTDVQEILKKEREEGKGKLKSTIQETAKEVKEYTREGEVVFIPESKGKLVVATDIHGDLKTLKQVLEKSKFIENMEMGDKSMQFVQTGDLVDRGPKQVEVMQLVMELKRRYSKNVTIFRADHEVYEGVLPHEFNDEVKKFYGLTLDEKTELRDPLFGGFFKVFEELPCIAVASNGAVLAHGGPAVKPRSLSELGNLPKDEVARVFDREMTWGDPVIKEDVKDLEAKKAELARRAQEVLNEVEDKGLSDDEIIRLGKDRDRKVSKSDRLAHVLHFEIWDVLRELKRLPDNYFQKSGKESREELIRSISELDKKYEDKGGMEEVDAFSIVIPSIEHMSFGDLKQVSEVLKSSPGFYPNGRRMSSKLTDHDWDACIAENFIYSEDGLRQFLDKMGGKFMLRAHQPSKKVSGGNPNMFDGMLWTIHTSGWGSDESYYDNREPDPKFAVLPLDKKQEKIKEENIISVW